MNYFNKYILFICAVSLSVSMSCKKKNNTTPAIRLRTIEQTTSSGGRLYRVVYDGLYNVDSLVWAGLGSSSGSSGLTKFKYVGTSFTMTNVSGIEIMVYADGAGKMLKVLQADTIIFHYKNDLLEALDHKTATTMPPYYTTTTEYYSWKDGDLTYVGPSGGTGVGFYYDMSKSGQAGDPMRIDNFLLYGRSYIKTNHLPMGMTRNADTIARYFYQFDGSNRISQLSSVSYDGSLTDTVAYRYTYR